MYPAKTSRIQCSILEKDNNYDHCDNNGNGILKDVKQDIIQHSNSKKQSFC